MTGDLMRYDLRLRRAMRGIVRDVLREASSSGLPDGHHFLIAFDTLHPASRVPVEFVPAGCGTMTVVIQHQFRDLEVDEEAFSVVLFFGGAPRRVTVPFDAVLLFADPKVAFELRFAPDPATPRVAAAEVDADRPSAEVVSLDAFRKRV